MRTGRPLRFLVTVVAGWVGVRAALLWPGRVVPQAVAATSPMAAPITQRVSAWPLTGPVRVDAVRRGAASRTVEGAQLARAGRTERSPPIFAPLASISAVIGQIPVASKPPATGEGSLPSPLGVPGRPGGSRWSGSLFAIARPSGTGGGLGSSQLGGSQAGLRVAYAIGRARRVALVGRVATPLEGRGREAALGVEWRVPGMPVRLFAERRFALDNGRGGPSLGAIAGVDRALGRGFRLEAYAQAGAIRRDRTEGFADGAARVTRRVAAIGPATLDLGAGAWGGAQRDAERLDVGPTLGVAAPVAGRTLRLTLDWRERVAGDARPGSGPALSVGTDF